MVNGKGHFTKRGKNGREIVEIAVQIRKVMLGGPRCEEGWGGSRGWRGHPYLKDPVVDSGH